MQSREEKHGQRNQEAMSGKHVTDKTNEDNEACMLRAHTSLRSQLENNEAHLGGVLRGFHFSNDPSAFGHCLQLLGYSGVVIL